MERNRHIFFSRLVAYLGLNNEKTAQERLEEFINEQKHQTLLDRIKAIRTNSYYVPNYDAPKAYTDIVITCKDNKPISYNTTQTCERPVDFKGDMAK